jgi:hypothetical protein
MSVLGENCIVVCLGNSCFKWPTELLAISNASHVSGACMELSSKQAQAAEAEIAKSKIVMCQSEADQTGNLELFKIAKKYGGLNFLENN